MAGVGPVAHGGPAGACRSVAFASLSRSVRDLEADSCHVSPQGL